MKAERWKIWLRKALDDSGEALVGSREGSREALGGCRKLQNGWEVDNCVFYKFLTVFEGWEVDNIVCLCFPKVFEGWKILIFHWFFKVFEGGGGRRRR